jgi:Uncharacterized protein conserved in bacteria (DUF2314)
MRSEPSEGPLFADLNQADSDVVEAIREARRTLPQFLDIASRIQLSPAIYLVKVPFIDRSKTGEQARVRTSENAAEDPTRPICHVWLGVTSVLDDLIFCSVLESPDALHFEDWMIKQHETAFGGFSLRVIRNCLGKEEQIDFDTHTGIREFKSLAP